MTNSRKGCERAVLLATVFVVACQDFSQPLEKRTIPPASTQPNYMMTGETEFDPNSPAAPDVEEDVAEEEMAYSELAGARLGCPASLNGFMIPGHVAPFHTTYVGSFLYRPARMARLGMSPLGVPMGRYSVPSGGPWRSEDGAVQILSGNVDGFCWYKSVRSGIALGRLHVYESDVDWQEVPEPPEPRRPPHESPCGDAIIEDPNGGTCEATGGSTGGESVNISGPSVGSSKWVCHVTDWYHSENGGPWIYVRTTVNDCWLEPDPS